LPGRSYKEAFEFGEFLCKRVTEDNPPPVQLKLEKVYLGSIMQTVSSSLMLARASYDLLIFSHDAASP
jgi:hypothetical protein